MKKNEETYKVKQKFKYEVNKKECNYSLTT